MSVGGLVDVGGRRLWVECAGTGSATVVFEAGGANDSTVWGAIAAEARHLGVRTLLYDRAGLGRSEPDAHPYSVEREVEALQQLLRHFEVAAPVVLVAHSYGGFISLLTAARDDRVNAVLLVDAVVPGYFAPDLLEQTLAAYRPQYAEVERTAPELARTLIPLMEAYPETARALESAVIHPGLPLTCIVAEHPGELTEENNEKWRRAQARFVSDDTARTLVVAAGSSHQVMQDRPDLVETSLADLASKIGASERTGSPAHRTGLVE
jgi:pimeloyl-ACP methyl ester carboxylesterase